MGNKETAIDFLFNELERCQYFIGNDIYQAYKAAKEMHKEQIEKAYNKGIDHQLNIYISPNSEEYYNETYANDTITGLPEEDSKRRAWHY